MDTPELPPVAVMAPFFSDELSVMVSLADTATSRIGLAVPLMVWPFRSKEISLPTGMSISPVTSATSAVSLRIAPDSSVFTAS